MRLNIFGAFVQLLTVDSDKHAAACFVHNPWLVWNQGATIIPKVIIKNQSTQWRSVENLLLSWRFKGNTPRNDNGYDFLSKDYKTCS